MFNKYGKTFSFLELDEINEMMGMHCCQRSIDDPLEEFENMQTNFLFLMMRSPVQSIRIRIHTYTANNRVFQLNIPRF